MINYKRVLESYKQDFTLSSVDWDAPVDISKEDIDEIYLEFKKIREKINSKPVKSLEKDLAPGCIYEMDTETVPLTVCVLKVEKDVVKVALMSYAFELATPYDLIVSMKHPLRDIWIVETDFIIDLNKEQFKSQFYFYGKLEKEDTIILIDYIEKGEPLPERKTGKGLIIPEKKEFKKIELKRYKRLFAMVLEEVYRKEIIDEVIETDFLKIVSDYIKDKIKKLKEKKVSIDLGTVFGIDYAVADTLVKPELCEEYKIIPEKNKDELTFIFEKQYIGKPVSVLFKIKEKTFPLFFFPSAPHMVTIHLGEEGRFVFDIIPFLIVKKGIVDEFKK